MQIQKLHYTKLNQPQKLQNNNKHNSKTQNNVPNDVSFKAVNKGTLLVPAFLVSFFFGFLTQGCKDSPKTENIHKMQEDAKKEFVDSLLSIDKKNLAIQFKKDGKVINNAFESMNKKTELLEEEGVYECFMSNEIKVPYNTSDEVIKSKIINDINKVKKQFKNSDASDLLGQDVMKRLPFDEAEGKRWAELPEIIGKISFDDTEAKDSIMNIFSKEYKAIADKAFKQARNNSYITKMQIQKMKKLVQMKKLEQIKNPKTFDISSRVIKIKYLVKIL